MYIAKKSYSLNLRKFNSEKYLKFLCHFYNIPAGHTKAEHLRSLLATKPFGLKII